MKKERDERKERVLLAATVIYSLICFVVVIVGTALEKRNPELTPTLELIPRAINIGYFFIVIVAFLYEDIRKRRKKK